MDYSRGQGSWGSRSSASNISSRTEMTLLCGVRSALECHENTCTEITCDRQAVIDVQCLIIFVEKRSSQPPKRERERFSDDISQWQVHPLRPHGVQIKQYMFLFPTPVLQGRLSVSVYHSLWGLRTGKQKGRCMWALCGYSLWSLCIGKQGEGCCMWAMKY